MRTVAGTLIEYVVLATSVTAIGGFLFGYDTVVNNGAISYLEADMRLDATQEGMAGASAILGCIPGGCARIPERSVRAEEEALPRGRWAGAIGAGDLPQQGTRAGHVGGLVHGVGVLLCHGADVPHAQRQPPHRPGDHLLDLRSDPSLFAFLVVLMLVPETKGRSLEEIEEYRRRTSWLPTIEEESALENAGRSR